MLSHFKRNAIVASIAVFSAGAPMLAQTFHGTVSGTVSDSSGAVITGANVQLVNPATGVILNATSSKAGEFNFQELPVGTYTLSISMSGFQSRKIEAIDVAVTKIENFPVVLSPGSASTEIEVTASGVQVDTQSSALVAVIDSKAVEDMPLNGRDFTRLTHFAPGVAAISNSVNGSRTASINFQLDGADNVDPWLGIVASNQGGIASVPGGLIPIEAIDQFSMQSGGEADQGRNAGANSNMVIKSGTNHIHGDVFYFDRNEFFAALSPVAGAGTRKTLIRNHQGGFTLGGPIWKDHTFLFTAGEIQIAKANVALSDTVVSDAWITAATANIAAFNKAGAIDPITKQPYAVSALSTNLYNLLYPANSKGSAATTNNYFASGTSNYNSYNGIVKLDHHFSDKQSLSLRYLGTTGTQTAPTASDYAQYFQTAPMHIHNFGIIHSYIFSPRLLNTVTFATNYFLQTFNDADQNFHPQANAGLNLGITNAIIAAGAPSILITGFDQTGATQPSGRTDVTGHVTDNFHWTLGKHELKFGGEYRHSNVNQLYFSSARGTFTFDGSRGPWSSSAGTQLADLSDFLIGAPTASSGARLLQGNAQRVWTYNTEDFWVQDDFQATKKLSLNYGIRYTVPGVIQAAANDIYQFVPGTTPGFQKGYYPEYYSGVAPRIGFSYAPFADERTVIRGSYGIFYDFPAMSSWITGTTTNGGAAYAQNNPAGPDAAVIFNQSGFEWAQNVNPFVGAAAPQVGAFGVNQNFKMPRATVVSFNVEQQLSKSTLFSVGYVGSFGSHLENLYNINQPVANGTKVANTNRPYDATTVYPNENPTFQGQKLLAINQLNFEAASNFHSLQTTVKQALWKGITATLNYTWSKSMDDASSSTTPMNSYNLHQDYGQSTFDNRNVVNGFVIYSIPQFGHFMPKLTKGYQVNALYTYSSGNPISPQYSTNVDGTGELKDRPNYTGVSPFTGVQLATSTSSQRTYRYLQNLVSNPSFTCPGAVSTSTTNPAVCPTTVTGVYGNEKRDNFTGPNFRTVDFSLIKHTPVTEKVMSEFRVEIFNIFNFNNFAPPTVTATSSSFGIISNTRNGAASPGIGFGEPFNIQFALKLTF
ncbi:TonB-dependent receptor [Granulicella tundricola]|uniref:TonB-dependent receptor, plug n=1 Tax=Granulicella tundricola (strain ATCC BAA-1859 / DSM 23138 / MP5ACTX9) TaxID=1198114 RepID=E8X674_GRATM|nr:TonB-dependent receptor [Granulicella tundricola]ADW70958.1 TonB-dependent receptor, plug [Granulicella tundricola MP5ACTX9]